MELCYIVNSFDNEYKVEETVHGSGDVGFMEHIPKYT